jgi:uncharacterized MnhB-related membrane protein
MIMADKKVIAGRVLTGLGLFPFLMGIYMTLSKNPQATEGMVKMGADAGTKILTLMVGSLALYVIPQTSVLGAVLITGYLGGAVATHMRIGEAPTAAVIVAGLLWGGLYLREPRLWALLPLRKKP